MPQTNYFGRLIGIFKKFQDHGIRYVVPRKHDLLRADKIPKSDDVDIIIWSEDYKSAIEICRNYGFSTTATFPERIQTLAGRAIAEPRTAIDLLIYSPKKLLTLIFSDSINRHCLVEHLLGRCLSVESLIRSLSIVMVFEPVQPAACAG